MACVIAAIWICVEFGLPKFSYTYSGATNFGILYFNPLARILEFTLGMSGALLWRKICPHLGSNIVAWTVAEIAAIGAIVLYFVFMRGDIFYLTVHQSLFPSSIEWLMHVDMAPFFLIVILVMASGAGVFARVLGTAPLVFLGEISYSVYMLHQILIGWYSRNMELFSAVPGVVKFLLFVAALLLLCAGTYRWIERPARNGVALFSRRPQ